MFQLNDPKEPFFWKEVFTFIFTIYFARPCSLDQWAVITHALTLSLDKSHHVVQNQTTFIGQYPPSDLTSVTQGEAKHEKKGSSSNFLIELVLIKLGKAIVLQLFWHWLFLF